MSPISTTNTSICETSNIFTGGGPGDQGALVEINGQQFIPSPFINISLEKYKMDNIIIGGVMKITLNGVVVDSSFTAVTGELLQILGSNVGANSDCVNVKVNCGGTFINGYGRILSVNMSEGQQPTWVNIAPYSIEIELYENNGAPVVYPDSSVNLDGTANLMLSNLEESFTLSITEDSFNWGVVDGLSSLLVDGVGDRHVAINFSISAAGINGCYGSTSGILYGLEAAETAIEDRISHLQSGDIGILNAFQPVNLLTDIDSYMTGAKYLQLRNITVNTMSNSISVEGSLIVRPSGCSWSDVFTTMNVSESVDTEGTDITIAGTITGLVNMNYSNIINDTSSKTSNCAFNEKMSAAESFLAAINNDLVLKNIAFSHSSRSYIVDNCITSSGSSPCGSILPYMSPDLCDFRITNTDIDRQYADGVINFTFTLSNKNNCNIPGANKVDVEVTTDKPHDNIVEILIPGRGDSGPIIQNLCCKSSRKITYSLTATLNTTRCAWNNTATIDSIRACAEAILDEYKQDSNTTCWFVVNDQETTGNNTYRLTQEFVEPTLP